MVYFPLIRHGLHRKQHIQQFFVAARMSLPSCYQATIEGYTDASAQVLFYHCVYLLLRERVRLAVALQRRNSCT
jgi:hypothetical protein